MTAPHPPLVRRVRRVVGRSLAGLRAAPYLRRWLVLGALIGVVAGLGSAAFLGLLHAATHLILGTIGGFTPATPAGEGGIHASSGFTRPWAIPLVVAGGMVLTAFLVHRFAPEAEGSGGDAAIDAAHHNPTGLRFRAAIVKMLAAALTIGSGGSGGREGPTAQISATFGSVLARTLNLSPADARIAVSSGIASGIGSIFRAPLGGAILGAELPYRDDVEVQALVPSLVASVVGFTVFGTFFGFDPIFGDLGDYEFAQVRDLLFFAILGVAAGLVGRVYITVLHRLSDALGRLRLLPGDWPNRLGKPLVAGLAVGGLGLAIPGVLGTGYGEVQQVMDAETVLGLPLWLVIALPFAKILATTLTIGSGGVGGIFGPGMVVGGVTGAVVWRVLELTGLPVPDSPVPFVIVGMITCFGSIAHAPLAVMLMVAEMTGNLSLLAPAMVSVALGVLVVGDSSIYLAQLTNRAALPANRLAFGLPMAAAVPVRSVMAPPRLVLRGDEPARAARVRLSAAGVPGAPVVAGDGQFLGVVSRQMLAALADRGPTTPVARLVDAEAPSLPDDATLDHAVDALASSRYGWVPVLDRSMAIAGVLAVSDLVSGYRLALKDATRRLVRSADGSSLMEVDVKAGAAADGAAIRDLALPHPLIVLTVLRGSELVFADATTVLRAGDQLTLLAGRSTAAAVERYFGTQA